MLWLTTKGIDARINRKEKSYCNILKQKAKRNKYVWQSLQQQNIEVLKNLAKYIFLLQFNKYDW